MGKLSIYEPSAGRNWMPNPSTEVDTSGWVVINGATLTADHERSTHGCRSLKAVAVVNASGSGAYQRSPTSPGVGQVGGYARVSCDVFVSQGACNCYFVVNYVGGAQGTSGVTRYASGASWNHWSAELALLPAVAVDNIYVYFKSDNNQTATFWLDGLDARAAATSFVDSYIDGDQNGCEWEGVEHSSTSARSGQYRSGGVLRDIDSYCGVRTVALVGLGPMPHALQERPYPTLPGSLIEGVRQAPREVMLVLTYKAASLAAQHLIRKKLNALFLPGRTYPTTQPLRLRYAGGSVPVEFDAYYVEGLEGDLVGKSGWIERIALVLRCPDPFVYEASAQASVKSPAATYSAGLNSFVKKVGGVWSEVANLTPTTAKINAIYPLRDGSGWLVGGSFVDLNGVAAADRIAKVALDGTVTAIGSGIPDGEVTGIAYWRNTQTYAVYGTFTSAFGVANTRGIAKIASGNFSPSAVHQGANNGSVNAVVEGDSGDLFVGGTFTQFSSVANTGYLCRIDHGDLLAKALHNGTFSANGGYGPSVTALALANGEVMVGGLFSNIDGYAGLSNLVRYDPYGDSWYQPSGGGFNVAPASGAINSIVEATDASYSFYLGGSGITSVGGVSVNNVAFYNGAIYALGPSLNGAVQQLFRSGSTIWVVGQFTDGNGYSVGGLQGVAYWDGAWHDAGLALPSGDKARAIHVSGGVPYVGLNGNCAVWGSYTVTVNNPATASVYPTLYFPFVAGQSLAPRVRSVTNLTTGQVILLDHTLSSGEVFVVDLDYQSDPLAGPTSSRKRVYSTVSGDQPGAVLSGSDLAEFCLVPGDNQLSFFVSDEGASYVPVVIVAYRKAHDSGDL